MNAKQQFKVNIAFLRSIGSISAAIRQGDSSRYPIYLDALAGELESSYASLFEYRDFPAYLESIINAMSHKNYVLLADILDMQLIPYIKELQKAILEENPDVFDSFFEDNLALLNSSGFNGLPLKQLSSEDSYDVFPSDTGELTIELNNKLLHSIKNPYEEARLAIASFRRSGAGKITLFGLGLGYYPEAALNAGLEVTVYESDTRALASWLSYCSLKGILESANFRLIFIDDEAELPDLFESEEQSRLLLPAFIYNIRDEKTRDRLLQMQQYDAATQNYSGLFRENLLSNLAVLGAAQVPMPLAPSISAAALYPLFEGQKLVIVGAGPSLEENIELLKNHNEYKILAAGAALRKLLSNGIRPDCVLIADFHQISHRQIEGLEKLDIPLVCISTVDRSIISSYEGPRYLFCTGRSSLEADIAGLLGLPLYPGCDAFFNAALEFCLQAKVASIALVGIDLANKGEMRHSEGTYEIKDSNSKALFECPSVDGSTALASLDFILCREKAERRLDKKKDACCRICNTSSFGADIRNTTKLSFGEWLKL